MVTIFLDVTQLKIEQIIGVEKKKKITIKSYVSYITVIVVSTVAALSPL